MKACRLMLHDLTQFAGLLLEEGHSACLAVAAYTLALAVVHFQSKLLDNRSNNNDDVAIRTPPDQLLAELATYKDRTAKLLQTILEARIEYGIYDRALDEADMCQPINGIHRSASRSRNHHDQNPDLLAPLRIESCDDVCMGDDDMPGSIAGPILYNMSVAYSLQRSHLLAFQTCQLALGCAPSVTNAQRNLMFKTQVLRRMHRLLVGPIDWREQQHEERRWFRYANGLLVDPDQISEEIFSCEVCMLALFPVGAHAA